MKDFMRFVTTGLIWLAFTGVVLGIVITAADGSSLGDGVILTTIIIFGLLAAYSTRVIWRESGQQGEDAYLQQPRKAKRAREHRLDRLIEQLDDDEIIELETLLAARADETYQ